MTTLKSNMLKKGKKGFTLTELAIVIAVIAILIAVLVPTFTSVITNAKVTAAGQEAHSAITAYTLETEGGLADGSVVVVDGQYYFEVNGGSIDTDNYTASIEGLNPYTWATNGDYASTYGDGKVTIYIKGVSASLETTGYSSYSNPGLCISGSGDSYYLTGNITYTSDTTTLATYGTGTTCLFAIRIYFDVKIESMTSLTLVGTQTKIWVNDNSTGTYVQSESLSSIKDGDYYIEFSLRGNTPKYTITYTYTEESATVSNTITIYNNATAVSG